MISGKTTLQAAATIAGGIAAAWISTFSLMMVLAEIGIASEPPDHFVDSLQRPDSAIVEAAVRDGWSFAVFGLGYALTMGFGSFMGVSVARMMRPAAVPPIPVYCVVLAAHGGLALSPLRWMLLNWPYWGPNTDLSLAVMTVVAFGWGLGMWLATRLPLRDG